jgi:hypothetical protein
VKNVLISSAYEDFLDLLNSNVKLGDFNDQRYSNEDDFAGLSQACLKNDTAACKRILEEWIYCDIFSSCNKQTYYALLRLVEEFKRNSPEFDLIFLKFAKRYVDYGKKLKSENIEEEKS